MPNPIPDMHILMLWHFNAICRQEAQPAVLSELGPRTIFLLAIISSSPNTEELLLLCPGLWFSLCQGG